MIKVTKIKSTISFLAFKKQRERKLPWSSSHNNGNKIRLMNAKGHLISERNFGVFKYPKKQTKVLKDFFISALDSRMGQIKKKTSAH